MSLCSPSGSTPGAAVPQAPKPPVLFARRLILWFWDWAAPEQPPVLPLGSVPQGHHAQGWDVPPACAPKHGSALTQSILSLMAVAKAHLGGSAKADGPCHELCHKGLAKGTTVSLRSSPGRDPIPWHPTAVGTGPPPAAPSIGGPLQPSCPWHPWPGAWGSPRLSTPLPN